MINRFRAKKSLLSLITVGLFSLFFLSSVSGQSLSDKVQVVTSYYEPYSFVADGEIKGVAVENAYRLFDHMKFSPKIEIFPWVRAYNKAKTEPNTLLFSIARTEAREEEFHWIKEITQFEVYLYGRRSLFRSSYSLAELSEYKTVALHKDVKAAYLKSKGFHPIAVNKEINGMKMVLAGRADLVPMDQEAMKYRLKLLGVSEDELVPVYHLKEISRPLFMAFSKNTDQEIVELFRNSASQIDLMKTKR